MTDKTSIFINCAREVHGDKYDYSKVKYINTSTKVIIICKDHFTFEQTPNNHIRGRQGCIKCSYIIKSNKSRHSTEEFIEKATKIHGDKYDYSKVFYINSSSKVIIICKDHGEFNQGANSHISGRGCNKCACITRRNINSEIYSTEEFIKQAKKIHGDKYDYSKVIYINNNSKVIIICKEHGEYLQTPHQHKGGYGCNIRSCIYRRNINSDFSSTEELIEQSKNIHGDKYNSLKEDFIEQSKKIHGDKYDYSKVIYLYNNSKVIIICKEHGEYLKSPKSHKMGQGCSKCNGRYRKNTDEFIIQAKKKFFDHFDYSKVIYKNTNIDIIIICKEHGQITMTPKSHLNSKNGCFFCGLIMSKKNQSFSTEEFIEKANKIHLNRYDYSKVVYVNISLRVEIICEKHGAFFQIASHHLRGCGCNRCCIKHSKPSIDWLNFIQLKDNIDIQHGENIGEFKIPNTRFSADGFCEQTYTIYEFHGDYWHGNPKRFIHNEINQSTNCTFGELYQRTLDREQQIKDLGYNLITIWENDWNKLNRCVKILQRKYRNSKLH